MINITDNMREQLIRYLNKSGETHKEFAKRVGVGNNTVSLWKTEKIRRMKNATWEKVRDIIQYKEEDIFSDSLWAETLRLAHSITDKEIKEIVLKKLSKGAKPFYDFVQHLLKF